MATQLANTDDVAFEHFREALASEPGRYPRGAAFLSAEAPFAEAALLRHIREGQPVVLVYADGEERIVRAARPDGWRSPLAMLGHALDRVRARIASR